MLHEKKVFEWNMNKYFFYSGSLLRVMLGKGITAA